MSDLAIQELSQELRDAIAGLRSSKGLEEAGVVTRVGDGVAWIYGLKNAGYNEVVEIETLDGSVVTAFVLNLLEDEIGAVLLGEDSKVAAGAKVTLTGEVLTVPVGPELVGVWLTHWAAHLTARVLSRHRTVATSNVQHLVLWHVKVSMSQ